MIENEIDERRGVGGCMSLYNSPYMEKNKMVKNISINENRFMNFIFFHIEKLK